MEANDDDDDGRYTRTSTYFVQVLARAVRHDSEYSASVASGVTLGASCTRAFRRRGGAIPNLRHL